MEKTNKPKVNASTLNRLSNTTEVLSEMTPVKQTEDFQILFDQVTQFYVVHIYNKNVSYYRTLESANQFIKD